jgi:ornithine cyclodeaminase
MLIIERDTIEQVLDFPSLIAALRDGFVAFHSGEAWVAPITNIAFPEQHGEMHIKPGFLRSSPEICVKIVTCFYDNPRLGMPTRDGAIVLADRSNGRMKALLADQGLITDMRTAGSSAVAVDALAIDGGISLGVVGAGTQAYWHAAAIACVRPIREVRIWGRDGAKAQNAARRI